MCFPDTKGDVLQNVAITKGKKYHVRYLNSWNVCQNAEMENNAMKIEAARMLGSYLFIA